MRAGRGGGVDPGFLQCWVLFYVYMCVLLSLSFSGGTARVVHGGFEHTVTRPGLLPGM